jgi:hypothetical protein
MSAYDPAAPVPGAIDIEPQARPDMPGPSVAGAERKAVGDQPGKVTEGATQVASTAQDAAKDVAHEAGTQARAVVSEVSTQARDLYGTTRQELSEQARGKTDQAAQGLRQLSDRVTALAEGRTQDAGALPGYLTDVEGRISQFAGRLEARGPEGLMDDVTRFARRRPLVFIGACAGAGFLLTRFVRAGAASGSTSSNGAMDHAGGQDGQGGMLPGPTSLGGVGSVGTQPSPRLGTIEGA